MDNWLSRMGLPLIAPAIFMWQRWLQSPHSETRTSTGLSSLSGRRRLAYTVHAGLLLALIIRFMSWIGPQSNREIQSRWTGACESGAAREVAMDNSAALVRSRSIRPPIKFMSPIHLTSEYRSLIQAGSF